MAKLLVIKHWQLFCLLMGIPLIFQFISVGAIISTRDATVLFYLFPVMMLFFTVIFAGWFYALGTGLYRKLPPSVKMNLTRFKILISIWVVYLLLFSGFMTFLFSNLSSGRTPHPVIFAIIFPLHLFSMFCIFYCLYFVAKSLKAVELQAPVEVADFIGEFFLIWFFPVGIWFIQPRVNKIFDPVSSTNSLVPDAVSR